MVDCSNCVSVLTNHLVHALQHAFIVVSLRLNEVATFIVRRLR
jgi:hypothetical protein